jgi:hypothetical protein
MTVCLSFSFLGVKRPYARAENEQFPRCQTIERIRSRGKRTLLSWDGFLAVLFWIRSHDGVSLLFLVVSNDRPYAKAESEHNFLGVVQL